MRRAGSQSRGNSLYISPRFRVESSRVQGMANDERRKMRESRARQTLFLAGYAVVNLLQLQHSLSLFLSPPTRLKMLPGCCLPLALGFLVASLSPTLFTCCMLRSHSPSSSCSFLLLAQLMQIVCLLPGHVGVSQSSRHASKTVIRRGRRQ